MTSPAGSEQGLLVTFIFFKDYINVYMALFRVGLFQYSTISIAARIGERKRVEWAFFKFIRNENGSGTSY